MICYRAGILDELSHGADTRVGTDSRLQPIGASDAVETRCDDQVWSFPFVWNVLHILTRAVFYWHKLDTKLHV